MKYTVKYTNMDIVEKKKEFETFQEAIEFVTLCEKWMNENKLFDYDFSRII